MKEIVNGIVYHYDWLAPFDKQKRTIVCLHGFTGSIHTFDCLKTIDSTVNLLVVDIIGHGNSASHVHPYRYQFQSVIKDMIQLMDRLNLQTVSLLGYSMGARLALGIAHAIPQRIDQLILESGSPGLKTANERLTRYQNDQRLAGRLINEPLTDFINFWENIPLFDTQKKLTPQQRATIRRERLSQTNYGLACSLLYMGTGSQPSYWQTLADLTVPAIQLIVGELDKKFIGLAKEMQQIQPMIKLTVIPDVGHCVHLEAPNEFSNTIKQLIREFNDENCRN